MSLEEAEALMVQANKKVNTKPGLFGMFTRKEAKFEDAYDMLQQAANIFKMNKKWARAADAYEESAKLQELLQTPHEVATCFVEAGKMRKKVDAKGCIEPFQKAAKVYAGLSRFSFAAKYSIEIAEILEKDVVDLERAIAVFEEAADYAEMDSSAESTKAKAQIKIAALSAQIENYDRATELYEEIANGYVEKELLKFSCKEYYLKAGLCTLCAGDLEGSKAKVERYEDHAAYFRDSREAKLLHALNAAIEAEDEGGFTQVVKEYDAVSKLDAWMTQILLKIKKSVGGEDLL